MIGYFGFPAPVMTPEATRAAANATTADGVSLVQPAQPRVAVKAEVPPEGLEHVDRAKLTNAAFRAHKAYPGPVGDLISEHLNAYAEFGFRLGGQSKVAKLVAAIMSIPVSELNLPPAA